MCVVVITMVKSAVVSLGAGVLEKELASLFLLLGPRGSFVTEQTIFPLTEREREREREERERERRERERETLETNHH